MTADSLPAFITPYTTIPYLKAYCQFPTGDRHYAIPPTCSHILCWRAAPVGGR